MSEYPKYSNNIWDYIKDMKYMPSREERDRLLESKDEKHLQIWDYFFRIKPTDVGSPQQREIMQIKRKLNEEANSVNEKKQNLNASITTLTERIYNAKNVQLAYGTLESIFGVMLTIVFYLWLREIKTLIYPVFCCSGPLFLLGLFTLVVFPLAGRSAQKEKEKLEKERYELEQNHEANILKAVERTSVLEKQIEELIKQIPTPPSNKQINKWLSEDMESLRAEAIESTGLGTRLVEIRLTLDNQIVEAPNPISITGPGELQDPKRIPPSFNKEYSSDRFKHLRARRAAHINNDLVVFYGVYYIEHILVADDMLATCGRFYDFITGTSVSERVTEQYYKDVVAIAATKEFRTIDLGDGEQTLSIENAPTFSLSLASGERRTVTFVNQDYFTGISQKLEIAEETLQNLKWVRDAEQLADNAIKALRFYLRKHKGISNYQ